MIGKSTLVSMFSELNINDDDKYVDSNELYHYSEMDSQKPPNIFTFINSICQQILNENNIMNNCSIIMTGESNKTKMLLSIVHYLNHFLSKHNSKDIKWMIDIIHQSNCILESFGYAKKSNNNNLNCFAKMIKLSFFNDHLFATIHNFIFEMNRIVSLPFHERNFNCFYEMLSAMHMEKYKHIFNEFDEFDDGVENYSYLNENFESRIHSDDELRFDQVYGSMLSIGFDFDEIRCIYKILASILWLGNIKFSKMKHFSDHFDDAIMDDGNLIEMDILDENHLRKFCKLLSFDYDQTLLTLTSRLIQTPNETIRKHHNYSQSLHCRNGMAKLLYRKLFDFIFKKINNCLKLRQKHIDNDDSSSLQMITINILDICGYEIFESENEFEQFLINYSNERLNQIFIDSLILKQQSFYESEDIEWKYIDFNDNIDVQNINQTLIICEKIFEKFDEITIISNHQQCDNDYFLKCSDIPNVDNLDDNDVFTIKHFVGDAEYTVKNFIENNSNQIHRDHYEWIETTTDPILREIFYDSYTKTAKMSATVSQEFRRSLFQLAFEHLEDSEQFYIRCINPIGDEQMNFNRNEVRRQIQYLGIINHIKFLKSTIWFQYYYEEFVRKFHFLLSNDEKEKTQLSNCLEVDNVENFREHNQLLCEKILRKLPDIMIENDMNNRVIFGRTMLFIKDTKIIETLKIKCCDYFNDCIVRLQTISRYYLAMQQVEYLKRIRLIFELFCQWKKLTIINKYLHKFEHRYFNQCNFLRLNRSPENLEYENLLEIRYRKKIISQNNFVNKLFDDETYNKILPEMIEYFNYYLIIMKFPLNYWNEKVLRTDAQQLFDNNKIEWGVSRKKWTGNYLSKNLNEYFQLKTSDRIIFAAKIIVPNSQVLSKKSLSYGLIMNETCLFKILLKKYDRIKIIQWKMLNEIKKISLSTGNDQLIVLNDINDNYMIFAFHNQFIQYYHSYDYRIENEKIANPYNDESNLVGEFVTLIWQRIDNLEIEFHTKCIPIQMKQIQLIEWNSDEYKEMIARNSNDKFCLQFLYEIFKNNHYNRKPIENDFYKISYNNLIFIYK